MGYLILDKLDGIVNDLKITGCLTPGINADIKMLRDEILAENNRLMEETKNKEISRLKNKKEILKEFFDYQGKHICNQDTIIDDFIEFHKNKKLREQIFTAISEASMCWEKIDNAGVFESTRAGKIAINLIQELSKELNLNVPEN